MEKTPWLITLRVKLIAAFLAVALTPLVILTLLNKRTTEAALTENANQALSAAATQAATSIDVFMEANLDSVRVEARLPGLSSYLSLSPEARKSAAEDRTTAMRTLQGLIRKDTINVVSYALLDIEGKNVLDTVQVNINGDESKKAHFLKAMETGLPYVSEVTFSGEVPQLIFSSLVRDSKNKKIKVGVLRCIYNLSAVQRIILEQTRLGEESTSFAILLDENHVRLAHGRSPGLVFKSLVPLEPAQLQQLQAERRLPERPAAELSTNLQDFDKSLRPAEVRFLKTRMNETGNDLNAVAVARLRHKRWTVAFVRPQSVFLDPIEERTTRDALVVASLIAVVVIAAAVLMAQLLTRPIIHVARAAAQLASGKLDTTVEVRSTDEMGMLARSFNQMARQLQESFEELEDRVEQRTAELKEAKIVADAASNAKSDFLANMSHELRTPLNGIMGYAQILRRSKRLAEQERSDADIIYKSGSHLLTLINDVLDIAKIEARTMELHLSDFHFPSFLRSTAEICRIRAEQKGLTLAYQSAAILPIGVRADERRLRQVLINLLGNAVKFTEKGSVTFTVSESKNAEPVAGGDHPGSGQEEGAGVGSRTIRFEIEDTGNGISADHLEVIFLPFKQVGSGERRAEGTGLGLAISQRIMTLMGSTIQVKSEVGKGSVFWMDVTLDESSQWMQTARLAAQGVIVGYRGRRRKILVVDDKWENRAVLVAMLGTIGFEMTEATDGQEGLEKAAELKADLIITDLVMPKLDGWEMIRRLRQMPELEGVKIIVSSASVFDLDRNNSMEAGADDFAPKPLEMDRLFQKIEEHLSVEWVYEQQDEARAASEAQHDSSEQSDDRRLDVVPPSVEHLKALLDLTRRGLSSQVQKYIDNLVRTDPSLKPFVRHLRYLLSDFRMDAMEEFINKYINDDAKS